MADETESKQGEQAEPQGTDWKAMARKHEDRAKANKKDLDAAIAERDALKAELEELRSSKSTADEANAQEADKTAKQIAELRAELKSLKAEKARSEKVRAAAKAAGVDPDVLIRMTGDSDEEIAANVDLLKRSSKRKWPVVPDEGEQKAPRPSKAEILAMKNPKERRRAIAENLDLFRED